MISNLFNIFLFSLPFVFFPQTSEIFEFNKIIWLYGFSALIGLAWIAKMFALRKIVFRRTKLDILLLLFLLSQVISSYLSIDQHTSWYGYFGRWNGGLLSLLAYASLYWAYVSNVSGLETKKIIRNMLLALLTIALWGVFEHYGHSIGCLLLKGEFNTSCWQQDVQTRVFATLGQPNWLAAYLVSLMPVAWLSFGYLPNFLLFAALVFTKSRAGVLGALAALSVVTLLNQSKRILRIWVVFALVVIFFGGGWWQQVRKPIDDNMNITPSSDIRRLVWKGALDIWQQHPWFGSGVETFAFAYQSVRSSKQNLTSEWNFVYNKAHNEYLNYLATTGALGLLTYLLLIRKSIFVFSKKDKYQVALLAGYTSILVTNFFGFSTVTTNTLFFLMPAMALSLNFKSDFKEIKLNLVVWGLLLVVPMYLIGKYWLANYFYTIGEFGRASALCPNEAVYLVNMRSEEAVDQAAYSSPNNLMVLEIASASYIELGKRRKSIEILERLALLSPSDPRIRYLLGISYLETRVIDKAKENFGIAVALKPDYEKARRLLNLLDYH